MADGHRRARVWYAPLDPKATTIVANSAAGKDVVMAEIVLGIGTSHSPMLNTNPEIWPEHVKRDVRNGALWAWDGKTHTYAIAESMKPVGQVTGLDQYIFVVRRRVGQYIKTTSSSYID